MYLDFSFGDNAISPLIATYIITISMATKHISLTVTYTCETIFLIVAISVFAFCPPLASPKKFTLKNPISFFNIDSGDIPIFAYTNEFPNITCPMA